MEIEEGEGCWKAGKGRKEGSGMTKSGISILKA